MKLVTEILGAPQRETVVVVAYIVLEDQDRPDASLLRAGDWCKVGVIDIAPLNGAGSLKIHSCFLLF